MNLPEISVRRPVLAIVLSLFIIIFGVIGYKFLGVREFPSIDPPVITVRTAYTGASPDVIVSQITEPLEIALNSIEGIRTISSSSNLGNSTITIEFQLGADLERAANDVRDKVSQTIRLLPQDIDAAPTVTKADANSDAILALTLRSKTRNQLSLDDYAENVIAQRLQTIDGVSGVQIWGQKRYAMRLWIDPTKLSAHNLTIIDVQAALTKQNIELPGGKIEGNTTELNVNTKGRMLTEEDFNNLILRSTPTSTVRFKDVGEAIMGAETEETILKESGVPMIGLGLVPQPGANYLDISDAFYKRVEQIKKEIPKDMELNIALDNTTFIRKSIEEVQETLVIAFILVILVIYFFFRDWVVAFRPLIDIPVSLIGSFFIMYVLGFTVNVLTLLAIVLATGLVVDDGIVVTENIFKKIEKGMNPKKAAIEGSTEIIFAVLSTSLTMAAVFMPVIFLQGFTGRLFREFGVVLAGSVMISAFVSLSLTPMLNAYLVRKKKKETWFYRVTEHFFVQMNVTYERILTGFLKRRVWAFLILGTSAIVTVFIYNILPKELAPMDDRGWFRMSITAPEGTSYESTGAFMDKLARFLVDSVPEHRVVLTVTSPSFAGSGAVNTGFVRIRLTDADQRKRTQQQIANYLAVQTSKFTEARTFILQPQTISVGQAIGLPIQYNILAPNLDSLKRVLPKFLDEAYKNPAFLGVDVNLKFNKPEINVSIDRAKAAQAGVSVADIGQTLQLAYSAVRFSYFTMSGHQYQVIGQVDRANRDAPIDLRSLYVRDNKGNLVQLDNFIIAKEESSPPQIYHFNRFVSATVSAGLAPGHTMGDGIDAMNAIAKKQLTPTFTTSLSGPSRDFAESASNLQFTFILSLILIYLLLAAQFESFADPLVIMFTVPLSIGGALLSLWYFNQSLNIFSEIGIIMLVGLVTKNGILIVEFANHVREEEGLDKLQAVIKAAVMRLRPILMTSIATIFGALPIAAALGSGVKSRQGMGIVVMGGLFIGLIFTLLVIPAMYLMLARKKRAHIDLGEGEPNPEPLLVTETQENITHA